MPLPILKTIRAVFQRKSKAHQTAHQYWKGCANTFLAGDPTYYDRQEEALRALLDSIRPAAKTGLDVGCGNGRFSLIMGEYLQSVLAFDLSRQLIDEASQHAANSGNVRFEQRDLEAGFPAGTYDVVAGMGIASTLIDEKVFTEFIKNLVQAVCAGGHLITKESLSTTGADKAIASGPYITTYRDQFRYENELKLRGMVLLQKTKLATSDGLANYIYLWVRAER